jgi:uncharacterized membrane protein
MLARTLLAMTHFKSPLLRTIVPVTIAALGIQTAVAIPSCIGKTEKYYDISGSLTYLSCVGLSLVLPALRAQAVSTSASSSLWTGLLGQVVAQNNWRQIAATAAVAIWAVRCEI